MKKVRIVFDLVNLAVNIFEPRKSNGKLAVVLPDFIGTKDYPWLISLCQELCELGFLVVSFDPRGTWESASDISEYMITNYAQDIDVIIDFVERKYQFFAKILLCGHSLGGTVGLGYSISNERIYAVAAIMPPPNIKSVSFLRRNLDCWREDGELDLVRVSPITEKLFRFCVPYSFVEDGLQYDLLNLNYPRDKHYLLLAGGKDKVIMAGNIGLVFGQIIKTCNLATIVIVNNLGHNYQAFNNGVKEVNDLIKKWLFEII
ncbi:MAG: alpha/beta hydrolase [bacterium]